MPDFGQAEPSAFTAGDTVTWTRENLTDYPATLWTLKYQLRGASQQTVTAIADGINHDVTITAATSVNWNAGVYWWDAYVTDIATGLIRHKVGSGRLEIAKNFAEADVVFDGRTHAKKTLDAIEATIEGRATSDQMAYSIAGRSLQRTPVADLLTLRDKYKAEYQKELADEAIARGENPGRKILVRF